MKEEKEIISEYFNNYYPQKRTIVLNEVGPFAPMGAGVVGGTAGEVAGTLSSGANIAGSVIGFGGLAIIALIIFFLIRGAKQDYVYVTGNVRDPGTYREMTSTLDTMINGKISPEDKEALQNYKQDLNDFQKEDQKILTLLKQLSGIKQEGFDKKTIDGITNLSDILLKIGEKKQTADQEIKIRNIVLQIQKDNEGKPVLQQICRDILDSLKNKEEIIKRSTGYQKLILKLSTKFPKLSDSLLSKLMFGTGKEDSLDLIKKAREFESNKKKQAEFLKNKQIPFQIEKIDDETGIKIKIAYDDKKDGQLLLKDDKVEIEFKDSSLNKKFKKEELTIEKGQEFLLNFVDLENEHTIFYEDFLNKFNGEIAEIKNFEVSEENLPRLKSIIKTYIDPIFLDTIKEYQESSKETKNKDVDFEKQLEAQIKDLAKKVIQFYSDKIKELEKISDPNPSVLSKKIRKSYKKILMLKKSILYNQKGNIEQKHDKYFEKIIEITKDVKSILITKIKSLKESLNKNTVQQDTENSLEQLKKQNSELYSDLIEQLNPILSDHKNQIEKIEKSLDTVIDHLKNPNSIDDSELQEDLLDISDLFGENQDNEEEISALLPQNTPEEELPSVEEDKRPLIEKLKDLEKKEDVTEIKQDITLDIQNKKFKSADSATDSYIKFLKNGNLEIYSKSDLKDDLKNFKKGFVFESKDGYKLVFKGKYKIESPKKGQKEGKINIYKITPVEDVKDLETDNKITDDQILEISKKLKLTAFIDSENIKKYAERYIVLKEFNNFLVPFYLSTGFGGKDNVSSKKWYPYLGNSENGYFWKSNSQKNINEKYGIKELQNFSKELDDNFGDLMKKENKIKKIDLKDLIENTNKSFKKDKNLIQRITSLYKAFGFKDEEIDKLVNNFLKTDLVDNIKDLKGEKSVIALDIILNNDGSFTESSDVTDYKIIFKQDRTYVIRSKNKESDESKFKKIIDSIFESKIEENFEKEYPNVIYAGNYEIKGTKVIIKSSQLIESGFQKEKKDNSDIKNIPETENEIFKITNLSKISLFYKDKEYKNGESFNIKKEKISVGRSENNDLVFKEKIVSEFHAVIELNSDKTSFKVIDNNSTNGTQYKQKDIESPQSFDSATDISFSLDFPIKIEVLESAKLKDQQNVNNKEKESVEKPKLDDFLLKNHFIFKGNELQPTTEKVSNKSHITFKLLQADTQKGFDTRYEITTIVKKDDAKDSLSLIYKENDLVITTKDLITERSKSNLFSKLITIFEKEEEQLNEIDFLFSEMSELNFDYESRDTVDLSERIKDKNGKFIITDFFKKEIREDIAKKIFDKRLEFFEKQDKDKKTYKELTDFRDEIEVYGEKFKQLNLITDDIKEKVAKPIDRLIQTFSNEIKTLFDKASEILRKINQYKKALNSLYENEKKYDDLNDGQKRLINLISVRNQQFIDNNPLIKDLIEREKDFKELQDLINNNGISKSLKNTPPEDFFEKLDEKVKDINVTKIGEKDYPEGESQEQKVGKESSTGTGDTEFEITNASQFSFLFNDTEITKDQKITIKLSKKDDFYFCINNNVKLRRKNQFINFIVPDNEILYTSAEIKFDKDDDDFRLALSEDSANTVFFEGKLLDSEVGETIGDKQIKLQLAPNYILKIKKLTQSNEEENTTSEGFTSKELFEELENYVTENGKRVPKNWSIHSFFIKKQQNKIIFLKKDTSDFYIILKNSDNFIYPFVIYKRKKSEDQIDLDTATSLFEASMWDTFLDKIDLALHKNYKKEDIPIYQGKIEVSKGQESYTVKFIKIEKIEENSKESSQSQTVKTEPSNNIILTAAQKIANLFKFTDKKTSEEEKKEIEKKMPEVIKNGEIDPQKVLELKDEANIEGPESINLGNTDSTNIEFPNKELEFSNTEKLILDKDFNTSTDEDSGIIFGFDNPNNNIWILNNTGNEIFMKIGSLTKPIYKDFNIFWGRNKEQDQNVNQKTSMFITTSDVPQDLSFEIGKKEKQMFKKQKTISFKYKNSTDESYKNKKNIKYFFEQIFIKEIKKEFFYNEQEDTGGIEKEKEVAEIKTQDDLMDYLFPSNVYKIDLDVGNKIQQENNFSEDALEKIKNGIIFYKRKDENFYRGQLKISDLSIFHKNEDLLKTYFNFYKNSEKIKNVLSEESKKLVEDIKHPDIMSGNYCQVQIDAVTSVINNKITTDYKITVLKKGIVSSDKFTEKFKTIDKEKEKDLISKLKDVVKKDLEEKEEEKPEEINQKEEIVPPKEEVSSEQYFISLDDIKNKKKTVSDTVKSDIGIIFTKNKQNFTGYLWIKQLNKVDELISFNEIIALRDYFNFNLQDFIINEEININDYKSGFISDNSLTVTIVNNEITSVINKGNVKNEYYTRLETSKQELLKTEIEKTNKEAAYKKFGLTDLLIREKAQEQITESPTGFIAKNELSKEGILIPKNYKNIDIMLSKKGYKVYYYIKNGEDYYYIDVNEKLFYILKVIIRGLKFFFGASNTLITIDKEIANSEIKLKDLKTILKVTKVAQDKNIKKMKFKFGKIEQKITKGNKTFFKFPLNTSMQPKIGDGKEQEQGNQTAVPQTEEFFENLIIKNIWKK